MSLFPARALPCPFPLGHALGNVTARNQLRELTLGLLLLALLLPGFG